MLNLQVRVMSEVECLGLRVGDLRCSVPVTGSDSRASTEIREGRLATSANLTRVRTDVVHSAIAVA
jgi:hypothetical protein